LIKRFSDALVTVTVLELLQGDVLEARERVERGDELVGRGELAEEEEEEEEAEEGYEGTHCRIGARSVQIHR
jgi:hypothetical protein